jgi:hypothetical protein
LGDKNQLKTALSDREHIAEDLVDRSVSAYSAETENGTWKEEDWPDMSKAGFAYPYRSYAVSKMAVNAYVSVLHNNTRLAAAGGKSMSSAAALVMWTQTLVATSVPELLIKVLIPQCGWHCNLPKEVLENSGQIGLKSSFKYSLPHLVPSPVLIVLRVP